MKRPPLPPHPATVPGHSRPPHPATVVQAKRGPGSPSASRAPHAARATLERASGRGSIQRAVLGINGEKASLLHTMSTAVFTEAKRIDNSVMEVQVTKLGGKYCFASNTAGQGNNHAHLAAALTNLTHAHTLQFDGKEVKVGQIERVEGPLHAEQNLLRELARRLRAAGNDYARYPEHVFVVGSKKPCTVCRRVLLSFKAALDANYPVVKLHFVNESGATTDVHALDLSDLSAGGVPRFQAFVQDYTNRLAGQPAQLAGENVAAGVRMAAVIDFMQLT